MKHIKTKNQLNETSEKLSVSDVVERVIQDKALEYVKQFEWDSFKEQSTAYSAFIAGCKYILSTE